MSSLDGSASDSDVADEEYAKFMSSWDVSGLGPGAKRGGRTPKDKRKREQWEGSEQPGSEDEVAPWEHAPRTFQSGTRYGSRSSDSAEKVAESGNLPVRLPGGRIKVLTSKKVVVKPASPRSEDAASGASGNDLGRRQKRPRTSKVAASASSKTGSPPQGSRVDGRSGGSAPVQEEDEAGQQVSPEEEGEGNGLTAAAAVPQAVAWGDLPPRDKLKRRRHLKRLVANLCQRILAWPEVNISGAPHDGQVGPIRTAPIPMREKRKRAQEDEDADDIAQSLSRRKARKLAEKRRRQAEAHARPAKVDCLKGLHSLCTDEDPVVVRLATLSQTAVLMDILPDFRIRLPTAKEQAGVTLSRDVRDARAFDRALLQGYQRFLKLLEEQAVRVQAAAGQSVVAVECLGKLMCARPAFNFGANIVAVVARMCSDSREAVRTSACSAVRTLFQTDARAGAILEFVRSLCTSVKRKTSSVRASAIQLLQAIPVQLLSVSARKDKRRKGKVDASLRADMDAADARDTRQRNSNQKALVESLMSLFFRVIRDHRSAASGVLEAVLKNVGRLAHLVDVSVALELVELFRGMLSFDEGQGPQLSAAKTLHLVLAAARILQGPGGALMREEDDSYLLAAYCRCLPQLVMLRDLPADVALAAASCAQILLLTRREPNATIVSRCVKCILAVAMHVPLNCALALVCCAQGILKRYKRAREALVGTEGDAAAPDSQQRLDDAFRSHAGLFDLHALTRESSSVACDPTIVNCATASAWELAFGGLLHRHFHPTLGLVSQDSTRNNLSRVAALFMTRGPSRILAAYDTTLGGFNPAVAAPSKHAWARTKGDRFVKPKSLKGPAVMVPRTLEEQEAQLHGQKLPNSTKPFADYFRTLTS